VNDKISRPSGLEQLTFSNNAINHSLFSPRPSQNNDIIVDALEQGFQLANNSVNRACEANSTNF